MVFVCIGMTGFQKLIDFAGTVAIDVDLGKHREGCAIFRRRKFENLGIRPGLLGAELIARKRKDVQAIRLIMKGTQTCVLISKTSTACDVDDETELSFELGQADGLTLNRSDFEIVQTGHDDSFDSRCF